MFCSCCGQELIEQTIFCKNCGTELPNKSKFCSKCGVAIHQDNKDNANEDNEHDGNIKE